MPVFLRKCIKGLTFCLIFRKLQVCMHWHSIYAIPPNIHKLQQKNKKVKLFFKIVRKYRICRASGRVKWWRIWQNDIKYSLDLITQLCQNVIQAKKMPLRAGFLYSLFRLYKKVVYITEIVVKSGLKWVIVECLVLWWYF